MVRRCRGEGEGSVGYQLRRGAEEVVRTAPIRVKEGGRGGKSSLLMRGGDKVGEGRRMGAFPVGISIVGYLSMYTYKFSLLITYLGVV